VRYHEELRQAAEHWIRQHPGKAARLFLGHVIYFWLPPAQNLVVRVARSTITVFAAWGLWLLLRRRLMAGYLLAVIWATFPLIYYVVYWSSRYRYPMEWTLVLAAAVPVAQALDRLEFRRPGERG
jgi:hypothetical protein